MSGRKTLAALVALFATSRLAATAAAQPGAYEPPPPPPAVAPLPPPPAESVAAAPDVDQGVYEDANLDFAWATPTAQTQPRGSWSFNDHELFIVGATYGLTDHMQLSAMTNVPIGDELAQVVFLSAKAQIARQGNLRLALQGTLTHGFSSSEDNFSIGSAGGVASLCLDPGCASMISGYLAAMFALDNESTETPVVVAVSAIKKLGTHVKFVGEIDSGFLVGEQNSDFPGYLGWYGLRFAFQKVSADVGFVKPFGYDDGSSDCPDCESEDFGDVFPIGLPWINFTYRGL